MEEIEDNCHSNVKLSYQVLYIVRSMNSVSKEFELVNSN